MTYKDLAAMAEQTGFYAWVPLDISTISLKQEVRDMCAMNSCGMYDKCWSCPPGCGTLEECAARLKSYSHGILVQSRGDIEDSFDVEGLQELEQTHKEHFNRMYAALRASGEEVLAIGAGCCAACAKCTYPDEPCRFPEKMVSSMEAYGMLVLEVCKTNGLQYYYGPDKMAYTSCFLLK